MSLPELTVAIWVKPHRGYGYFIEIDSDLIDDNLPGGFFQSFKDTVQSQSPPQALIEFPYKEFKVTADQMRTIIQLADNISYSFTEHAFTPMLGGSFYGLRVARGFQEATIVWHGRFEDQDASIRELYAAVQMLADA